MKYKVLKFFTILLQVLAVPFGVYAGSMLALGNGKMFFVGVAISMAFSLIQASLWWKTMENMKNDKTI